MNILRLALELLVFYIVYKLVVNYIIPIYKTSKEVKSKMNEMQQKMAERQQPPAAASNTRNDISAKPDKEDYIDYEEVK